MMNLGTMLFWFFAGENKEHLNCKHEKSESIAMMLILGANSQRQQLMLLLKKRRSSGGFLIMPAQTANAFHCLLSH